MYYNLKQITLRRVGCIWEGEGKIHFFCKLTFVFCKSLLSFESKPRSHIKLESFLQRHFSLTGLMLRSLPPLLVRLLKHNSINKEMSAHWWFEGVQPSEGAQPLLCVWVLDHTLCIVNAADRKQVNGVGADGDLIAVTWFIKWMACGWYSMGKYF